MKSHDLIFFACPHCDERYGVADDTAGRALRCATCGAMVLVPTRLDLPRIVPSAATDEEVIDLGWISARRSGEGEG